MAKKLATTKMNALDLLLVLNRIPTSKLGADVARYLSARRAVKAVINDYIDKEADIIESSNKQIKDIEAKEINKLKEQLLTYNVEDEDYEKKKAIINEKINHEKIRQTKIVFGRQVAMDKLQQDEKMTKDKVEITFDNEDFNFIKNLIVTNANVFFSYKAKDGEELLDSDAADKIILLLESAQ